MKLYKCFSDGGFNRRFENWIHVKLPTEDEIKVILTKKINKHNNCILEGQFKILAKSLRGYSPFDVDKIIDHIIDVKDEQLETETHFTTTADGIYKACSSTAPGATALTYKAICEENYDYSVISFKDIQDAMKVVHPTNSMEDDQEFVEFAKELAKKNKNDYLL